jgi:hypothetical protein
MLSDLREKTNGCRGNSTMTKERRRNYAQGQGYGYRKQSVEKLKEKWPAFMRGIIHAIAEEEMKISREEFDRQIGTRTR